jgi:hypothetical protein
MIERGFRKIKIGEDVRAERAFELFAGDLAEVVLRMLFGGVVDEDVQPAEFLHGVLDHVPAGRFPADIAGEREALAFFRFDEPLGFPRVLVFVQVSDGDVRAFPREQHRDGAADAAVAAGDERDFALEFAAAVILGRRGARARNHFVLPAGALSLRLGGKSFQHVEPFTPGPATPSRLRGARSWRSNRFRRRLPRHGR